MLAPTIEEIAKEYDGKLKVCKINIDTAINTASENGIMSIPTVAIFKGGKIVDQIVGVVSKKELAAKFLPFVK